MVTQILPWNLLIIFCNIVTICFEEYPDSLKQPKQPCVAWSATNSKICHCVESTDVVRFEATFKGIGLDHHDANTSLYNSVSFGGEFSHVFNLKNMISTHTKDFWEKNGPGSPDF